MNANARSHQNSAVKYGKKGLCNCKFIHDNETHNHDSRGMKLRKQLKRRLPRSAASANRGVRQLKRLGSTAVGAIFTASERLFSAAKERKYFTFTFAEIDVVWMLLFINE
jgi:hypothetical protein